MPKLAPLAPRKFPDFLNQVTNDCISRERATFTEFAKEFRQRLPEHWGHTVRKQVLDSIETWASHVQRLKRPICDGRDDKPDEELCDQEASVERVENSTV